MKIEIDSIKDTNEEIINIIAILEGVLKTRGITSQGKIEIAEQKIQLVPRRPKDRDVDDEEEVKRNLRFEIR